MRMFYLSFILNYFYFSFLLFSNKYIIKEKKFVSKEENNRFIFQIRRIIGTILIFTLYTKIMPYTKWFIFGSTLLKFIFY